MNKQEAIEKIRELDLYGSSPAESKKAIIPIVNQIHEPQKVVVPKFVAEWIEETKKHHTNLRWVWDVYPNDLELNKWLKTNTETFMLAWIFGYEVEKEQLYTVEIPNPALDNLEFVIVLKRLRGRVCLVNTYDYMGREISDEYKLTEAEIKQDFEWAWQWAEPVEVE